VRTSNLIYTEGVSEQGAEQNIWTQEGGSNKIEKTTFTICTFHQILGKQIKEDEIGRAVSTHVRSKKCAQNFSQCLKPTWKTWAFMGGIY
jgi:hypothetical protein